jgi:hypothetical protein
MFGQRSDNEVRLYLQLFFLFSVAADLSLGTSSLHAQGSVSIINVSYPHTAIESGNYVEISIGGAAAYGTVSSVQNGGSPYVWPTSTDASGNWSITAQETSANVGNYSQTWYVNGTAVTPNNASGWSVFEATLPSFQVYAAGSPSSPSVLTYAACGNSALTLLWTWTPVNYYVTTAYGDSPVNTAAGEWNGAESLITLQTSTIEGDIDVADGTLPVNTYGQIAFYSQACNGCYNQVSDCTGACENSTALYYADMVLNNEVINDTAGAWGVGPSVFAADVISHETGHSFMLADIYPSEDGCSLAGSVLSNGPRILCGINGPTSADIAVFNSNYPNGPNYCSPGGNYCSGTTC